MSKTDLCRPGHRTIHGLSADHSKVYVKCLRSHCQYTNTYSLEEFRSLKKICQYHAEPMYECDPIHQRTPF